MKVNLTPKQSEALKLIQTYTEENGYAPSYDEMVEGLGLTSKSGINRLVVALDERGYITRIVRKARTIKVVA